MFQTNKSINIFIKIADIKQLSIKQIRLKNQSDCKVGIENIQSQIKLRNVNQLRKKLITNPLTNKQNKDLQQNVLSLQPDLQDIYLDTVRKRSLMIANLFLTILIVKDYFKMV